MWQALLAFLGVIVGGVIAGGVTLWQTYLAFQREREARQVERAQLRKDAHDAFQRDAIIALHEAVHDFWESAVETHTLDRATPAPEHEQRREEMLQEAGAHMVAAYSRQLMARAKVFDDELRHLSMSLDKQLDEWVRPSTADDVAKQAFSEASNMLDAIEARVNVLLKNLA
jgi:pantothenate kinase type III